MSGAPTAIRVEPAGARRTGTRVRIDPRLVLAHIVVLSTLSLTFRDPVTTAALVVTTAAFVGLVDRLRSGATIIALWATFTILQNAISALPGRNPLTLLLPAIVVLARLAPLTGAWFLFTGGLTVSRFVTALESLRVPRAVTLPLAVMLRFAPTIGYELAQIRDALHTRGIPPTPIAFARSPLRTAELVVVPLVQRCLTIAEELSASAVTRGIENPLPRSSRLPLRFGPADAVYAIALSASTAAIVLLGAGVLPW